ncbi:MAG TPA: hypothetical protein VLV30_07735, partial [Methanomicrobiales archaeon]|nr:hypothetical protein [Methanomicrobiales archaeon]
MKKIKEAGDWGGFMAVLRLLHSDASLWPMWIGGMSIRILQAPGGPVGFRIIYRGKPDVHLMKKERAGSTAIIPTVARVVESRSPAEGRLFTDPFAEHLLSPGIRILL